MFNTLLDLILHLDRQLDTILANYGSWTYALLFIILLCETGLVVTPFLPGDSLLFAAGALAARAGSPLHIGWLVALLALGAILGDTLNYWIGHAIGPRVFTGNHRLLNRAQLQRTQQFYARHGGKTVVLARFIPIIRTFAPFVAGVGRMHYTQFVAYNVLGGISWVGLFLLGGYVFGDLPGVQHNFGLVVLAIIALSLMPVLVEVLRHRSKRSAV